MAFLDVLGFSQLVWAADASHDLRLRIDAALSAARSTVGTGNDLGLHLTQFSDSIVLSADAEPAGFDWLLMGCEALASNLLQIGFLLRGGIACGNMLHTSEALYGPALLLAYGYEKRGGPPRISIDPSVMANVGRLDRLRSRTRITSDPSDDVAMVHTFAAYEHYDPRLKYPGMPVLDGPAKTIVRFITANTIATELDEAARKKWRWTREYWNRSVARAGHLPTC